MSNIDVFRCLYNLTLLLFLCIILLIIIIIVLIFDTIERGFFMSNTETFNEREFSEAYAKYNNHVSMKDKINEVFRYATENTRGMGLSIAAVEAKINGFEGKYESYLSSIQSLYGDRGEDIVVPFEKNINKMSDVEREGVIKNLSDIRYAASRSEVLMSHVSRANSAGEIAAKDAMDHAVNGGDIVDKESSAGYYAKLCRDVGDVLKASGYVNDSEIDVQKLERDLGVTGSEYAGEVADYIADIADISEDNPDDDHDFND